MCPLGKYLLFHIIRKYNQPFLEKMTFLPKSFTRGRSNTRQTLTISFFVLLCWGFAWGFPSLNFGVWIDYGVSKSGFPSDISSSIIVHVVPAKGWDERGLHQDGWEEIVAIAAAADSVVTTTHWCTAVAVTCLAWPLWFEMLKSHSSLKNLLIAGAYI